MVLPYMWYLNDISSHVPVRCSRKHMAWGTQTNLRRRAALAVSSGGEQLLGN
jgi:hypothetical protein